MRKTLKILLLAVMLLVMVGVTMLVASAEGEPYEVGVATSGTGITTSYGTYATFDEALAALATHTDADIVIKEDTTLILDKNVSVAAIIYVDGAEVTIEVKEGFTLTAESLRAQNGGVLNINGGSYKFTVNRGLTVYPGAKVVAENATFNCTHTSAYAFYATAATSLESDYAMTLKNVKLTGMKGLYAVVAYEGRRICIEGDNGSYLGQIYNKGGVIDIKGGTFEKSSKFGNKDRLINFAASTVSGLNSETNISGGTFTAPNYYLAALTTANNVLNITGGTFKSAAGRTAALGLIRVNYTGAVCTIGGGTFTMDTTDTTTTYGMIESAGDYGGTLIINGGTFYSSKTLVYASLGTVTLNGGVFQSGARHNPMNFNGSSSVTFGENVFQTYLDTITSPDEIDYDATAAPMRNGMGAGATESTDYRSCTLGIAIDTTGTVIINGGVYQNGTSGAAFLISSAVTINDGTFVGYRALQLKAGADVTVTDGNFYGAVGQANVRLVDITGAGAKLTVNGGTFDLTHNERNNPGAGGLIILTADATGATVAINDGNFIARASANTVAIVNNATPADGAGTVTVSGGNFAAVAVISLFKAANAPMTVSGGTFTMEGGAILVVGGDITNITFTKLDDKAPHFVIGSGAEIPSEGLTGYNGQYANATWELQGAAGLEAVVDADLTITTIAGLAAVADAAYERFFATALNGYNDIKVGEGGNCVINKPSDALASVIVPINVTLTLAMEEAVDVAIPLVIVKAGGTLVIEKGVYTNTATEIFENEAGSTVIIKGGTFDLKALNIYGNFTIEAGDFTLAEVQGFVVKVGGKADVQGGNFSFTLASSTHGFRLDVQSDDALADTEPSLTLGAGVNILTDNRYAVVVYGNRKAEIKGGTYYGCLYVAGELTIEDGYFYAGENTYNIASTNGYRRHLHPTNSGSFSGSITVNGGTFMARTPEGNTDIAAVRHVVGEKCSLTINGGTHTLTGHNGIGIYNAGTLVITEGFFTMPTLQSTATGSLEITGGDFTFTDKGIGSAINVLSTSTISGGTFTADGDMTLFALEGEEVYLTVTGGTFTVKNGAAVAESFAGITFAPQDYDVNNLKFIIEAGSGAPSVNVEGAAEACFNAYWDIRSWSGFEVRVNTTFTSLADYAAAVKAYAESSVSEYNPGFQAGYNCEVNVEVTEWTHVVVVEGVLTLNMNLLGSGTLVTVEKGGTLIVAGGTYEVTGDDAIFVLNGGALEIQDGTYTAAKAFVTDTADSTITVTGGTISIAVETTFNGDVTISGGTISIAVDTAFNGDVTISGGTVNIAVDTTFNGDVTISGGTINAGVKKIYFGGNTVIEDVNYTGGAMYVNAGYALYVNGGDFTLSGNFIVYPGAFANIQGGKWNFTAAGAYGFYANAPSTADDFEIDYSLILGGKVEKTSANDYSIVVKPGRKVKVENGTYNSGRVYVSGTLDIFDGTFKNYNTGSKNYVLLNALNDSVDGTTYRGYITVYNGKFYGNTITATGNCTIDIYDGEFELTGYNDIAISALGTVTITGGTFNTATIKASDAGKFYISGGNFTFNGANTGYAIDAITDNNDTNSKSFAISGGATFTVNIDVPFVGLGQYASATFDNAKVIAKTFMDAATTGSMEILDMVLIVTGEDEVIFDVPVAITKAVVVANTKNMTSDVTLSGYVQVRYGGEKLYNAWVKVPASAELSTELDGGAAIEVTNPSKAGIRFTSKVSTEFAAYLLANYPDATFTFGTLIAPADYVAAAGSFTIEKLEALGLEIPYVNIEATWESVGGTMVDTTGDGIPEAFSGALINLKSYTRAYAAVSYVKVETADETVMIYGAFDTTANARSAQEIAEQIIANENSAYYDKDPDVIWSTEQKAIVGMYAGKVAE